MKIRRFRKNQTFRVVTQGVHFFTTAKQIRQGVGDECRTNASIQKALESLEFTRSGKDLGAISNCISGRWEDRMVQIDIIEANLARSVISR